MDEALIAETVGIAGHDGDEIEAYPARPLGVGSFGGVVVIHHVPGYDGGTKEITGTFAAYRSPQAKCPHRKPPR
jgi:carboxymethylenebutenolidase